MPEPKAAFMKLEDGIKSYLGDTYEASTQMYQHAMAWALRWCNEMQYDTFQNVVQRYLGVDTTTMTAKLPDDYVQYTKIGLVTNNNEFVPLVHNPSIVINPFIDNCDTVDEHCDCGCDNELCYTLGESNMITTTDGDKTITTCVGDSGTVTRKVCQPVVTNVREECDYQITFGRTTSELTNSPWSNFFFTRDGVVVNVGDVADSSTLTTVMDANGFALVSQSVTTIVYGISDSAEVWTKATYTDNTDTEHEVEFVQSACAVPTPITEEYCYEETICDIEVLPCGCVKPTQLQINVICNCGQFACAVTSRQRNRKDFGQYLAQPKGYFGEFNIDVRQGIIRLNWDFQYNTVYMEYYSAQLVDTKNYLIPIQSEECLVAYLYWKSLQRKRNTSPTEKVMAERTYYNEKRKLKQRLTPIRIQEFLEVMRVFPRP